MIQIDQNSCIGCKACIKDCPAGAIRLEEGKAVWKKECIQCGHCVAVCPVKAVSIPEYDMEEVEEYDRDTFTLDPDIFLHAVKFRRSIRNYKETPVEREKMERILNAGRYAATAKNTQACRFLFLQKDLEAFKDLVWEEMPGIVAGLKETLPAYARLFEFFCLRRKRDPKDDPLFFNTTSFLVITAKDLLDGGLAAANIENMAVAEGAGVLYSGYLMRVIKASARLKEWLGITEEEQIACCMLMGYPAVSYRRTAPRREGQIEWR